MNTESDTMNAEIAYDIGRSDGQMWVLSRDSGALAGDHEGMIPDDFYPAYVRGVGDGIREQNGEAS